MQVRSFLHMAARWAAGPVRLVGQAGSEAGRPGYHIVIDLTTRTDRRREGEGMEDGESRQ